jgi:hypothetical protein
VDNATLTVLINAGVAGVIVVLYILGVIPSPGQLKDLKEENKRLREALALERARGDTAVQATNTTNHILGALHDIASYDQRHRPDRAAELLQDNLRGIYEATD